MRKMLVSLMLFCALAMILAGCGGTPGPTAAPSAAPTQTPWIIVFTPTPGAEVQPSPTPQAAKATPPQAAKATPTQAAKATPTQAAKATPSATAISQATVPGPTETTAPAAGPATPTRAPRPTDTPPSLGIKYPPPVLLDPPNNRPVSWGSTVLLQWSSVGELADDEYYHVHMERRPRTAGEPWYGDYVYTKDTEYRAEGAFLAPFHPSAEHGHGVVYWWVRVVHKTGQDQAGKPIGIDISPYSEERTLIVEPKPAGQ
jgi:hypothetical protein